jgi:hypothetical protein
MDGRIDPRNLSILAIALRFGNLFFRHGAGLGRLC